MTLSVQTYIGKSRNDITGALVLPPSGSEVPRPFDIRHIWRQPTGRDTGGILTLATLEGMDWIYNQTRDTVIQTLMNQYDRLNPRVWVYILDPYSNAGAWYEASMFEPHVERGAGNTVTSVIVSFRAMTRYEE
jgi:hypothetical protein